MANTTSTMPAQLRVCLLHNVVAPYRLPVFEEVARTCDLEVWFCKTKTSDRLWSTNLQGYRFKYRILPVTQLGPFFLNLTLLWRLLRQPFDVYVVGDFPETAFTTFTTSLIAKLRGKPVVLWSETVDHDVNYFQHLTVSTRPHHRLLRRLLTGLATTYRRALLRLPNHYIALSRLARHFLEQEGINPSRITSGIQVMPAAQLPAPSLSKSASPYAHYTVILSLGYLNPSKGIDTLIRAVRSLPQPDLRLIIAGSGPAEAALRQLAAGDPRIEFVGYVDEAARANYFAWSDIFVLPTLVDCWAMVVNEAMHYGLPVITTTAAGASELITDHRSGLIVPPRQPEALAAALKYLLADPNLRQQLAGAGQRRTDITDPVVGAAPIIAGIQRAGGKS